MQKNDGFKQVGGGDFPPTYRFDKVDQQLIGVFVERRTVTSDKIEGGKSNAYTIDVLEDSTGMTVGKVTVWGTGMLDWLMEGDKVKAGDTIRLTYKGKKSIKKGKKSYQMNDFLLEIKG